MVETDWRQILDFSQRELNNLDKEQLCENLSWMEADDIELNFANLKTLFRLAQDILKFKSEQVSNLHAELEISKKKRKRKSKSINESPSKGSEHLETLSQQEALIKSNKDTLQQLYDEIAELEGRKHKLENDKADRESDSSRDALSEMNAIEQLESDVALKNRHIRKLLHDVKELEDDNLRLKEKTSILKDKLAEATQVIENLTEQLFAYNNENTKLKELLGKNEEKKSQLSLEIETIKKDLTRKDGDIAIVSDDLLAKIQLWKNVAKARKSEIENLAKKNLQLQDDIKSEHHSSPKDFSKESTLRELQEKLSEATHEIFQSAKLIEKLKIENITLKKNVIERNADDVIETELKNESDDRKQRALINQLKTKNEILLASYKATEEALEIREKELQENQTELQLLKSDAGFNELLNNLKLAKSNEKQKDGKITSLVQEVNSMNNIISELQMENETLRQKYNIEPNTQIPSFGILKKCKDLEEDNAKLKKRYSKLENLCTSLELDKYNNKCLLTKITCILDEHGIDIKDIRDTYISESPQGSNVRKSLDNDTRAIIDTDEKNILRELGEKNEELNHLISENEGLRKGLQEILHFLKENNASSAGVLALECPSLEAVLHCLDARHSAGWFAPHMATMCELKTAIGGRDALLTALQEARKETIEVTNKLSEESQKAIQLEQIIIGMEAGSKTVEIIGTSRDAKIFDDPDLGSWMSEIGQDDIDFTKKSQVDELVIQRNTLQQNHLQKGLTYFYDKFKFLLTKMTELSIKASDEKNEWAAQEEHYKSQIEQLSLQLLSNEDDSSVASPGAVSIPDSLILQRKCEFLNESYRHVRSYYENLKNEFIELKKDTLIINADHEVKIQKLIITIINLTDKVRDSVSMDMFCKQNRAYNELILKYRELHDKKFGHEGNDQVPNLLKSMQDHCTDVISKLKENGNVDLNDVAKKTLLTEVEQSILQKQVERLCEELQKCHLTISNLEEKNVVLQETQAKLFEIKINDVTESEKLKSQQIKDLTDENIILKEEHRKTSCRLENTLLQLQDIQQRQNNNDLEINMLRHQILDLQSTSDNKAIIARLSSEVMVAHLQAAESLAYFERLDNDLKRETQRRIEAEEMLMLRENIFSVYSHKYETKFRFMFEMIRALKEQYLGSLPLMSLESYQNKTADLINNLQCAEDKLNEIEDLRSNLAIKHGAFNEILELQKRKCLDEDECQHKLKMVVTKNIHSREMEYLQKKLDVLEQQRKALTDHCNNLEKTLILVNQGMQRISLDDIIKYRNKDKTANLEVEDVHSDEETSSRKSQTITLPKPHLLKTPTDLAHMARVQDLDKSSLPGSPVRNSNKDYAIETTDVFAQTVAITVNTKNRSSQTDGKYELDRQPPERVNSLQRKFNKISHDLSDTMILAQRRSEEILNLNTEKESLQKKTDDLKKHIRERESVTTRLKEQIAHLSEELNHYKAQLRDTHNLLRNTATEENKSLLMTFKKFEQEKNSIIEEYKTMLANERAEFQMTTKELNRKVLELQVQIERCGSNSSTNADTFKDAQEKYSVKITQLEGECFRLQGKLDECRREINTYQSEAERWKELACERLAKMELLTSQLEQRHSQEVESYKAENQHWLSQYNDYQREQLDLRNSLSELKSLHAKQMHEKDGAIEHMRSVINGLKTQLMSMQTVMSATDPGFDLSAIVEAEGDSEAGSNKDTETIDFHKYDSQLDVRDDSLARIPACSTAIWQEPLIDRLRREKQLCNKQNAILRRQVKALAARERRARLEVQNLRNQLYRLSTSGTKVASAESVQLQAKIATLQEQLMHSRRDVNSHLALWDKGKRSQQAADRWQAKYEAKCVEVRKLESSLNSAKSFITRLEREKRMLMRAAENKTPRVVGHEEDDNDMMDISNRDCRHEVPTRDLPVSSPGVPGPGSAVPAHISTTAMMDRIEAQQRRIAALELADHGNEALVSEYERALAEITALKGQLLSLESTLLESQIRIPTSAGADLTPELDYWKSYCEMLKEENIQLSTKLSALESAPTNVIGHQQRINDLEQTVLTLRGLVSKLQAESKSSTVTLRRVVDSRPNSSRATDKEVHQLRSQIESYRIEIANLKKSTLDKDNLLERSKEMLKIAAEREETLLREVAFLRRQINEYRSQPKEGFLSS